MLHILMRRNVPATCRRSCRSFAWYAPPPPLRPKASKKHEAEKILAEVEGEPLLTVRAGESWALLGVNASGKTSYLERLAASAAARNTRVASFGFEAHRTFVEENAGRLIGDVVGNIATAETRELVVRLGLVHAWARRVAHASTGEVRKTMLAAALAGRSEVLLLDQPYDGLDQTSCAELKRVLTNVEAGESRLLVDLGGTSRSKGGPPPRDQPLPLATAPEGSSRVPASLRIAEQKAPPPSLVLVTQRDAEMLPKLRRTVVLRGAPTRLAHGGSALSSTLGVSGGGGDDGGAGRGEESCLLLPGLLGSPPTSMEEGGGGFSDSDAIRAIWEAARQRRSRAGMEGFANASEPLIDVVNGSINFASSSALERVNVMSGIDWRVERGQVWAVLGDNGTGKSSLGRLFTLPASFRAAPPGGSGGEDGDKEQLRMFGHDRGTDSAERARRHSIGGVSTEVHMAWANACRPGGACAGYAVRDVIGHRLRHELREGPSPRAEEEEHEAATAVAVEAAAALLRVGHLLGRRFDALSQGEQKLAVVAAALAHGPELVVVDEGGQGLDLHCRAHLANLWRALVVAPAPASASEEEAARVCSLVVITHHADEIPRGATHALRLGQGAVKFCGEASQLGAVGLLTN